VAPGPGLQASPRNFISGLIISSSGRSKWGDFVEIRRIQALSNGSSLRCTEVVTLDALRSSFPNSEFLESPGGELSHGSPTSRADFLPVGVAY